MQAQHSGHYNRLSKHVHADDGILVIINHDETPEMLLKITRHAASITHLHRYRIPQSRQIGLRSQIYNGNGVRKEIRLLSSHNQQYRSLSGFDLEVVD